MPLKFQSTGGGTVTLDVPSTSSTVTLTIPANTGNLVIADTSGNANISGNLAVTGTISTGTVAMASSFKRNRIINGNFNIWQRGTSFTSSSVNEYSADRWRTEGYSLNSVISQQTFTVGQTAVPGYPTYYCRVTTSSAPSSFWSFTQRIECPQNINGDGTYTLSFWAKAVSGTIAAATFTYGINAASNNSPALTTTWQKITVTTTLSGVSQASGYLTIYIVSVSSSFSSLSVDIANVQVEEGTVATPYERQIYSDQFSQCQRYYEKGSIKSYVGGASASGIAISSIFKVTKRSSPTMSYGTSGSRSYVPDSTEWAETESFGCIRNNANEIAATWIASAEL